MSFKIGQPLALVPELVSLPGAMWKFGGFWLLLYPHLVCECQGVVLMKHVVVSVMKRSRVWNKMWIGQRLQIFTWG